MGRLRVRIAAVVAVACAAVLARAGEIAPAIDLTTFGAATREIPGVWDGIPLEEIGQRIGAAPRRWYVSAMLGPSFASLDSPVDATFTSDETLLAAGGALGVAFERPNGRLRIETEGMGRTTYDAPFTSPLRPDDFSILTNNWSVMENLWRDLSITDRFGIYGGGGIGAGGYILGERLFGDLGYTVPAGNFAWQAGGGFLWEITDRLTFDVGYRYFRINTIQQAQDVVPNLFQASELMFTLRLYEPLRGWRR